MGLEELTLTQWLEAARELMGVSQHVLGRTSAAQEEFAQLLKLAPKHELDPFVVPPPVVQTFEEVRAKMKPLLDKIGTPPPTGDPDPPPTQVKTRVEVRAVPHAAVLITPLGIPQFVLDEPAWGVMWGAIQVVGLGLNILGAVLADGVSINPADNARYNQYLGVMYGGLAVFAGGWIGSGVHGLSQLEDRRAAILRAPTAPPPGPSAQLGWSWRF